MMDTNTSIKYNFSHNRQFRQSERIFNTEGYRLKHLGFFLVNVKGRSNGGLVSPKRRTAPGKTFLSETENVIITQTLMMPNNQMLKSMNPELFQDTTTLTYDSLNNGQSNLCMLISEDWSVKNQA